eukprot:GEMP01026509.1.p1 GENE.GEMP01026509.1~~GEMP01026509.1.p1  ORF type:complete len:299 (+),score=61.09 GEMP01026509.1:211-1107(+)
MTVVIDRFAEFSTLRARFNNEAPQLNRGKDKHIMENTKEPEFMTGFFADVAEVQKALAEGRSGAQKIERVRFDALQCVTKEQEEAVSTRLDTILFDTNKSLTIAKTKMDQMKHEEEGSTSPPQQMAIRKNMYAALIRKFSDVVKEFHAQEELYRKQIAEKTQRQLQLAFPDKSESEITEMVADGQDTAQVVKQKMGGTHASVLDALNRVQDKYKDVRRLEKSMQELNQMYMDMAKLVDYQGEMVDSIVHSVTRANEYVESGHEELVSANKSMKKKRKLMCMSTCCIVVVVVILLGVFI